MTVGGRLKLKGTSPTARARAQAIMERLQSAGCTVVLRDGEVHYRLPESGVRRVTAHGVLYAVLLEHADWIEERQLESTTL
ncbi:hypothetical protein [Marinithermus hydrothermalis]|uniref:Uncharacterized protein n=1 Tax=Marinithermus hydrothermalis (strain DSM 14884 / JCM 11576 / T1) TaxID=869210 RepID=F2NKL2_MARHT|nr:hypothetical protein [Marinithermus hydrothermalis]AEB12672.1 hypothetical protein Marky_1942 [Marinithermus hydrothermalis DSM 14884]